MIKRTMGLTGVAAAVLLVSASADAAEDPPFTAQQEERLGEIVRDYLLEHPEIINEAMLALRERQAAEEAARVAQALQEHKDELLADPMSPVGGNLQGAVTAVEFFDYNCPYCRAAVPMVTELLQKNPDVRFVYKEFPTLAPSSRFAAQAALAARRQSPELYTAFHNALMKAEGRLTEDGVVEIAREAGVDVDRMHADMEEPRYQPEHRQEHPARSCDRGYRKRRPSSSAIHAGRRQAPGGHGKRRRRRAFGIETARARA